MKASDRGDVWLPGDGSLRVWDGTDWINCTVIAQNVVTAMAANEQPNYANMDDNTLKNWVDSWEPMFQMRIYKYLNSLGFRIATIDHQIRVEQAKLLRAKKP